MIVSYGGGTNSVAMLVGLRERELRPDEIVFADTGGEKPHTYQHLWETMQPWCERVGFPSITIVRGEQRQQQIDGTLEQECLRLGTLPSRAYGFGMCSDKWKADPYFKWERRWMELTARPRPVKLIGFHAGEEHRCLRIPDSDKPFRQYPLIEWGWDYEDCIVAIERAGLPLPGKSACFFCPSSTVPEILQLRTQYPDLLARALAMERRAMAGEGQAPVSRCGLGRRFAWDELLRSHDQQPDLFASTPEQCGEGGCFT